MPVSSVSLYGYYHHKNYFGALILLNIQNKKRNLIYPICVFFSSVIHKLFRFHVIKGLVTCYDIRLEMRLACSTVSEPIQSWRNVVDTHTHNILQRKLCCAFICGFTFQGLPATGPHHYLQSEVWTNGHPASSAGTSRRRETSSWSQPQ